MTLLRLAVSPVVDIFSDIETQDRMSCILAHLLLWVHDACAGVLAGRRDTLGLVDLLLIDILVIFFTRAIFQPQGCHGVRFGGGTRADVCLNGLRPGGRGSGARAMTPPHTLWICF